MLCWSFYVFIEDKTREGQLLITRKRLCQTLCDITKSHCLKNRAHNRVHLWISLLIVLCPWQVVVIIWNLHNMGLHVYDQGFAISSEVIHPPFVVPYRSRLRPVQAEGVHGPAGGLLHWEGHHRQGRRRHHQEDLQQPVTAVVPPSHLDSIPQSTRQQITDCLTVFFMAWSKFQTTCCVPIENQVGNSHHTVKWLTLASWWILHWDIKSICWNQLPFRQLALTLTLTRLLRGMNVPRGRRCSFAIHNFFFFFCRNSYFMKCTHSSYSVCSLLCFLFVSCVCI